MTKPRKTRWSERWIRAEHHDGWTERLAGWTLEISPSGRLVQLGAIVEAGARKMIRHDAVLGDAELDAIRDALAASEFVDRPPREGSSRVIEDVETQRIIVYSGTTSVEAEFRGASWLADEGEFDARRFLALWDAIHRFVETR